MRYFENPFSTEGDPEKVILSKENIKQLVLLALNGRTALLNTIEGFKAGILQDLFLRLLHDERARLKFISQINDFGLPTWFVELLEEDDSHASHLKIVENFDSMQYPQSPANEDFYE